MRITAIQPATSTPNAAVTSVDGGVCAMTMH
jgi:hypothetical protein